jgi:LacI family transcriptional regulator
MATINDVAEKAGVSITTVSHVINETRYVSDELTERVYEAMRELNYRPNTLARSLRSGRTKTIGLVIPDISNLFFAEISRKIEDKGFDYEYSVILCNTDDNSKKEESYINVLLEKQVDGIIFISAGEAESNLKKPKDFGIPTVIADRDIHDAKSDVVLVDNLKGGYDATKYLISHNHKRIGCISGPSPVTPSAQRLEGYKMALIEAGYQIDESLILTGDFRYEGGEMAMRKFLDLPSPPTAVFACNDMMALGAIRAVKDRGLMIPEDISLIGFDNIPISKSVYPALTTFAQPIKEMADLIVDLLVTRIAQKKKNRGSDNEIDEYKKIVLEAKLIERGTCKFLDS